MKRVFGILVAFGLSTLSVPAAHATPFDVTFSWKFALASGVDVLGLDGASGTLALTYDDGDTYAELFGLPETDAFPDSLTISGAVAGVDGSYAEPDSIGFYPTSTGGVYFGGGPANGNALWLISGVELTMLGGLVASVNPAVLPGDAVDISHFGTTFFAGTTFRTLSERGVTDYSINNFTVGPASVPEPATLALLGIALAGLGFARRRKPH